jgi:hypothetical protein
MRVLDDVNARSFAGFGGGSPLYGSDVLDSWIGSCLWGLSLGSALVMGDLMGRHFGVGCGWFFFRTHVGGGRGRGRGNSGTRPDESFSQDDSGF